LDTGSGFSIVIASVANQYNDIPAFVPNFIFNDTGTLLQSFFIAADADDIGGLADALRVIIKK
jgi:hypothetical protein